MLFLAPGRQLVWFVFHKMTIVPRRFQLAGVFVSFDMGNSFAA